MHRKRWITGIVALPILILLVSAGGPPFYLLVAAAAVLTLYEYNRAVFPVGGKLAGRLIPLMGLGMAPVIIWRAYTGHLADVSLVIAVDLILVSALTLPLFKDDTQAPYLVAKQVLGLTYITVPLAFLVVIHKLEYFVNARIIGGQIQARAWELLIAMVAMEAAFGVQGVIAAPIIYAYAKKELSDRELI